MRVPFIMRLPLGLMLMTPPVFGADNTAPAVMVRSLEDRRFMATLDVKLAVAATTSGVTPEMVLGVFKVMAPAVKVPCTVAVEACGGAPTGARRETDRFTCPGVLKY